MRHCYVLRVFTRGDTGGNHLGVVTDLTGLTDGAMQGIAAELGFSETTFVDWAAGSVPRVRIFTPAAEVPFAGHPLVGTAWVLGALGPGAGGSGRMVCGIGEVGFRATADRAEVEVPLVDDVEGAPEGDGVASAARLPAPIGSWWVRMPIPYLVLEVSSATEVAGAAPDIGSLAAGASGEATYLFARQGSQVKARFFAPGLGVAEDPATGSAAASLAAVLAHRGEPAGSLAVFQGDEIGHPSTIEVSWAGGMVALAGSVRRDEVRILER